MPFIGKLYVHLPRHRDNKQRTEKEISDLVAAYKKFFNIVLGIIFYGGLFIACWWLTK